MNRKHPLFNLGVLVVLGAFVLGLATAPTPAQALSLGGAFGDLVKIFGIGWVVKQYGTQIDSFINKALAEREAAIQGWTKVVPIVKVGTGKAVGAAQVMGPREQVEKVQAVAEVDLQITGALRARGLIPVTTKNASPLKGVGGVGVSANIKFQL